MRYSLYFVFLIVLSAACSKTNETVNIACGDFDAQFTTTNNNKVLIIGLDGFLSEGLNANNTPFLDSLSKTSTTYYNSEHKTEKITYSGPNWTSIVTGAHQNKHQVLGNDFTNYQVDTTPTIMKYIDVADSTKITASYAHWFFINAALHHKYTDFAPFNANDDSIQHYALNALNNTPTTPDYLFLHYDDLDIAGHGYGFSESVTQYASALARTDNRMRQIFAAVENKRNQGENWLIIIISDHGGEGTEHGQYDNPKVNQTICFINHPNLQFKTNHVSTMVDIAPTVLDFMQIQSNYFDCLKDGVSLIE